MPRYKVTLNWYGELLKLYTNATGILNAMNNAQFQLANKLGINVGVVKRHINSGDKIRVEKEEE